MYKPKCVRENRGMKRREGLRERWKDGEGIGEEKENEQRAGERAEV